MKALKIKPLKPYLSFLLALGCYGAAAQTGDSMRVIDIEEITVTSRRALAEIGAQKTELDSAATRDNITKSLADVLSQSSTIFIKSYGRATLSTASFRGTAPSHTQVTWNDLKLNSPMLGMVDFSLIPSYFIDEATLYHGASSVGITGGGLGGAVTLGNRPAQAEGFALRYIQGVSSFDTYDQFLRLTYGRGRFRGATKVFYAASDNDFTYTNYRKKRYLYNDAGEMTGSHYPTEKNKNGDFRDFHFQQEFYLKTGKGDHLSLSGWYTDSRRGMPMLSVNYRDEDLSKNRQDERTLRVAGGWERLRDPLKLYARGGYTYTDFRYAYLGDKGNGRLEEMIRSDSYVHTVSGKAGGDYYLSNRCLFSGNIALNQHFVSSIDRAIVSREGQKTIVGYDQARSELSGFAAVRYRPSERLGLSANVRKELYGTRWSPVIPAVFAEYTLSRRGQVVFKASAARNYRYPTLNDLYFMPGGNPDLQPEKGFTYDAGVEFRLKNRRVDLNGEATFYDSYIKDWILWLPTAQGFWSPANIREVHSYGLELKGGIRTDWGSAWWFGLDSNYTLSHAVNRDTPSNWADNSVGKQLVYIPKHSNAATGRLGWQSWTFACKYNYYSERFTTTSNETQTKIGRIGAYYMTDLSLEKAFSFRRAGVNLKFAVNNLFDEEYESVLSRPMAGRNYGFFIEIIPSFRQR